MQCRLIRRLKWSPSPERQGYAEPGTVIDNRDAWLLVLNGDAEPADEECDKRTGYSGWTDERKQTVLRHRERMAAGIHPEDFEAFDAGLIAGYGPDGSTIPGPNAIPDEPEEESMLWLPDDC
jgi:hypothetical protein